MDKESLEKRIKELTNERNVFHDKHKEAQLIVQQAVNGITMLSGAIAELEKLVDDIPSSKKPK